MQRDIWRLSQPNSPARSLVINKSTRPDKDRVTSPATEAYDTMSTSEIYPGAFFKGYRKGEANEAFQITRDQFVAGRKADVRGTANPSVMNNPFWISQVSPGGLQAWNARIVFGNAENPFAASEDPVWCFSRFGATYTKLPDGRVICIGGEHEDGYDPDFCIYNGKFFTDRCSREFRINPPQSQCSNLSLNASRWRF